MSDEQESTTDRPENEWSTPAYRDGGSAARAASFTKLVGIAELLLGIVLVAAGMTIASRSEADWRTEFALRGATDEQIAQWSEIYSTVGWMIVAIALLLVIPGVIYLLLSRGIRAASSVRSRPVNIAYLMMMTQAVVLGTFAVSALWTTAQAGNPVAVTMTVILLGTPLCVLIYCMRLMVSLRRDLARRLF